MKKTIIPIIILILLYFPVNASSLVTLLGKVTDKDNMPILEAVIYLEGSLKQATVTDSNGYFMFANIIPGTYKIKVQTSGYDTHQREIVITDKEITTINVVLKKDNEFLEQVAWKAIEIIILLIK